ncbi:uncharacterized protein BN735_00782 [Mycoplasma sp. CAG:611]|nr:uncharacterized protein BN735_00782 [Mycoplasma sp. CAG:611]
MSHYFTNENLKSNIKKVLVKVSNNTFTFNTDNGVFSKKGMDFGTRTLIEVLLKENLYGDILDVGCGYGVIGIILSSFFNNKINSVSMVDVNLRAIHLTKMNIKENKVNNCNAFVSNVYENIDKKYDFIITNPPIRAGKDIVYKILKEAKDYLKENGCLYYVINKNQGALSSIKEMKKISKVEVLEKNKGFYIIKCIF